METFCSVPWHLVIWDEAHQLKNDKTGLYKAAVRSAVHAMLCMLSAQWGACYAVFCTLSCC